MDVYVAACVRLRLKIWFSTIADISLSEQAGVLTASLIKCSAHTSIFSGLPVQLDHESGDSVNVDLLRMVILDGKCLLVNKDISAQLSWKIGLILFYFSVD